jgi:hypothetical protein
MHKDIYKVEELNKIFTFANLDENENIEFIFNTLYGQSHSGYFTVTHIDEDDKEFNEEFIFHLYDNPKYEISSQGDSIKTINDIDLIDEELQKIVAEYDFFDNYPADPDIIQKSDTYKEEFLVTQIRGTIDGQPVYDEEGEPYFVWVEDPIGEPDCKVGLEHKWVAPYEVVGGMEDNPGVWQTSENRIYEKAICENCGIYREFLDGDKNGEKPEEITYSRADEVSLGYVYKKILEKIGSCNSLEEIEDVIYEYDHDLEFFYSAKDFPKFFNKLDDTKEYLVKQYDNGEILSWDEQNVLLMDNYSLEFLSWQELKENFDWDDEKISL